MPDRESVITHLQIIHTWALFARERDLQFFTPKHLEDIAQWSDDAIAMLKEQEAKGGHWIVLDFCANEGIYCSECHMKIFDRTTKPKKKLSQYCPHCGSRNEQFFKDGEVVFR